ncbi:MAG: DUF222 domain-containing protein, partial [Actinobacteria bacterium]|nr:DUF222 domain-containing protein [Actinomycetota bacterium]
MHENATRLLNEERIREILTAPASMSALNELYAIEVETLCKASKVDYLSALQRQMSFLQEWSNRVMISLAGVEEPEAYHPEDFARIQEADREEIAAALRVAPATAQLKLDTARMLANHLPLTSEALATGEISPAHATVIARETERAIRAGITPQAIAHIEERALSHAEMHTPGQVANKVKALIAKVSPEEFEEAVEAAIEQRRVEYYPESDGMATVLAILPATEATMLKNALDAMAKMGIDRDRELTEATRGQTNSRQTLRTMDQRRADALAELAAKALNDLSDFYKPQRRPVTVNITMDLATAMGLSENPAMLSGYGPIPASIARELAADGKWRRFVTEPQSGNLLDLGRETYEPPQ